MEDNNENCEYDINEYPYYITIKKLLYAFGDCYRPNHKTVLYFHDFIKKWLIAVGKMISECEMKKVLDHLYSFEYSKFHNYKKLKIKNCNDSEDENEKKDDDDILIDIDEEKGGILDNLLEDKDENYFENLAFQDERTKNMNDVEYMEYNNCRTQSFLTKGKKNFINFLQNIIPNTPYEFRDQNNLEFISFLLKEILHKVIKQAIKNRNPDKKLIVVEQALQISEIEELATYELELIDSFMNDYYNSIYLIKEFKKKKFDKENNKNVKVKKKGNSFFVIIKKFIFLDDCDNFKKIKKKSEKKILEYAKSFTQGNNKKDSITIPKQEFIQNYPLINPYEYFLLKELLSEDQEDNITLKLTSARKMNKKYLNTKLKEWLSLPDRSDIAKEFNKFTN
jgi:hypothetical protein